MLFQNLLPYTLEGLKINWHHHLTNSLIRRVIFPGYFNF